MSRLARNPIALPNGVTVEVSGQDVKVKGSKGEMAYRIHDEVSVALEDGDDGAKQVRVNPRSNSRTARALWGTMWAQIRNRVVGVSEGYSKNLEIQGVGLRANMQGSKLVMQLGFSHDVEYEVPKGVTVEVEKQTAIKVSGIDKDLVGAVAAKIKSFKPPEPYKGKGIRYTGEFVLRKEGKKK
ncbi:MAG TPA: 50S ribosomal protein L6 [Micavibrio sp.]|nr:50S ribosomal protein L6 [Micavibrio sp.]HIL27681.1 50S ribosomal protein L6 [Micavibrio sp.]|tara:strand:+ start:53 stop:601 length:549 start_codon:yes stop_codon:yes gene_type:complete